VVSLVDVSGTPGGSRSLFWRPDLAVRGEVGKKRAAAQVAGGRLRQ